MADQEHPQDHSHEHEHEHEHEHDHAHEHEQAEERGEQTVTVEEAGPARKRLIIEVPQSRIAKKLEEGMARLKTDAAIPGFRRGRAPRRLIERRFATSLRDDAKAQLLSECYTQAIEDEKLEVIGEPDVKDLATIELPEDGPLKFQVEVEISPEVQLPSLEGLEVKKSSKAVSDEDVAKEVNQLRDRYGELKEVPETTVQPGDYVQVDTRILPGEDAADDAEQIVHNASAYVLVHGEEQKFTGHILGIVVEDLGRKFIDRKPGDTVRWSMIGPANHEDERIKGKPITIVTRINKVERLEPAALETLLKNLGLESEEQLRERVQQNLSARREREEQAGLHKQVADQLLEKTELELPPGLTGRQTARVLRRRAMELAYQGVSEQEIEQRIAEMRAGSEEEARRQLKLFFLLDQAAKDLNVEVSENEVNGRVAVMAVQQGRRPEKLRQQMQRSGELETVYLSIREQKTLDKIIEKAKVTEEPAASA